ncbi:hypothetical protein D3C81_1959660 [compost metagenome]
MAMTVLLTSSDTALCSSAALAICRFMSLMTATAVLISSSTLLARRTSSTLLVAWAWLRCMAFTTRWVPACNCSMTTRISLTESWVRWAR